MADGGRQLVFARINNEVLLGWVFTGIITSPFLIGNEVDVRLYFSDLINPIVDCVYVLVGPHFSDFSFGIVLNIEVKEHQSLCWLRVLEPHFGVVVAEMQHLIIFKLMLPFSNRFCVLLSQILNVVVNNTAIFAQIIGPTTQTSLVYLKYYMQY